VTGKVIEKMYHRVGRSSPVLFLEAAAQKKERDGHDHTCPITFIVYERSDAQ